MSFLAGLNRAHNRGPAVEIALDREGAADQAGAVMHDAQPHALGLCEILRQAQAVVFDHQHNLRSGRRKPDRYLLRLAVFNSVGNGFLGDTKKVGGEGGVGDPPAEDDLRPDLCGRCARALLRRAQAYESVLVAGLSPDRSTLAVTVGRN